LRVTSRGLGDVYKRQASDWSKILVSRSFFKNKNGVKSVKATSIKKR
jgi:hypothetical protein